MNKHGFLLQLFVVTFLMSTNCKSFAQLGIAGPVDKPLFPLSYGYYSAGLSYLYMANETVRPDFGLNLAFDSVFQKINLNTSKLRDSALKKMNLASRLVYQLALRRINHASQQMNHAPVELNFAYDPWNKAFGQQFYIQCINVIRNAYHIDGNYGAAIDLLTGYLDIDYSDTSLKMFNEPQPLLNMLGVINALKKKMDVSLLQAYVYNNVSLIYTQVGNVNEGIRYQVLCINEIEKMQPFNETEYLKALVCLGKEYLSANLEDSAKAIFSTEESSINTQNDTALYISYLDLKASLLNYDHKYEAAIKIYEEIFRRLKQFHQEHIQYYDMALQLGRLYMHTQQHEKADSVFKRNFDSMYQSGYRSLVMQQMIESLTENLICMHKYDDAAKQLIGLGQWMLFETQRNSVGLSENDAFFYASRMESFFNLAYTLVCNGKSNDKGFMYSMLFLQLQQKTFTYLNRTELLRRSRKYWNADTPLPYRQLRDMKQSVSNEMALPVNRRSGNDDSIIKASERLERKIAAKEFSSSSLENINIQTTGTNIEFVRFNYLSNNLNDSIVYAAYVFEHSSDDVVFIPLCCENDLLKLMKDTAGAPIDENQLSFNLYDSSSASAIKLYNLIWKPLQPYLKNAVEINYSPAGLLYNIAFNSIYDGKTHLLNTYKLHCYLSLPQRSDFTQYNAPKTISIWGNMNYDTSAYLSTVKLIKPNRSFKKNNSINQNKSIGIVPFPNLIPDETDTLKQIFKQHEIKFQSCEYEYATEDSFKKSLLANTDVLQISTHGFYTPYSQEKMNDTLPGNFIAGTHLPQYRCGLAFSGVNYYWKNGIPQKNRDDGILTASEIEELNLSDVRLVALSACETGLGDVTHTEGNLGVYRAFKLAGTHYVLASLWEVSEKETAKLFTLFYTNWLQGQPLDDALRNAQLTMQKDKDASPFQWGGFVLIE